MNIAARALRLHTPTLVKSVALTALFACAAHAFRGQAPRTKGLLYAERLEMFARFTRDCVDDIAPDDGALLECERILFDDARRLGRRLRCTLGVRTVADAMSVGRTFYGALQIDLCGDEQGEITVSRCFFSRYYSPRVCRVVSALDAGIFAGLTADQGRLVFSQRISEGGTCCRASLGLRQGLAVGESGVGVAL